MRLSVQTSMLNVSESDRSIGFYQGVFDLPLLSRSDQLAVLLIDQEERAQVLLLHEVLGLHTTHPGRGAIGLRVLGLEAGSPEELTVIEQRLVERSALVRRHRASAWEVIVGVDPDRIEISVSSSLTGSPIHHDDWSDLDELLYDMGA